jgi:putative hydrolase of the HAD superfamily
MRPLCVVFDLDDTLYLERDYVRSGFAAVGRWAVTELGVSDFETRAWQLFTEGERESIFQTALAEFGITTDQRILAQMTSIYRAHRPVIQLLPDSIKCLTELDSSAILGLITDGDPQRQRMKCDRLGLCNWLSHVIYTGDWGAEFHKPHPRAYEAIQYQIGRNCRFVYVADNPAKDFISPLALGWDTVRVRRSESMHFQRECALSALPRTEIPNLWNLSEVLS